MSRLLQQEHVNNVKILWLVCVNLPYRFGNTNHQRLDALVINTLKLRAFILQVWEVVERVCLSRLQSSANQIVHEKLIKKRFKRKVRIRQSFCWNQGPRGINHSKESSTPYLKKSIKFEKKESWKNQKIKKNQKNYSRTDFSEWFNPHQQPRALVVVDIKLCAFVLQVWVEWRRGYVFSCLKYPVNQICIRKAYQKVFREMRWAGKYFGFSTFKVAIILSSNHNRETD